MPDQSVHGSRKCVGEDRCCFLNVDVDDNVFVDLVARVSVAIQLSRIILGW